MSKDPPREPVTIITDTLDHWPFEFGSLTPDDKSRLAAAADRRLWEMFDGLFEDMAELFPPKSPRGWIVPEEV